MKKLLDILISKPLFIYFYIIEFFYYNFIYRLFTKNMKNRIRVESEKEAIQEFNNRYSHRFDIIDALKKNEDMGGLHFNPCRGPIGDGVIMSMASLSFLIILIVVI